MFVSIQTVNAHDEKGRYKKNKGHYYKHQHKNQHNDQFRNEHNFKNPYYRKYDPPIPYHYYHGGAGQHWQWGHPNMQRRGPRNGRTRIRIQIRF